MSNVRPRQLLLVLLLLTLVILGFTETTSSANYSSSSAQRLRVRVEKASLEPNESTKVFVEFLDMNYQQVANDATREIVLGQASPGSRNTGTGYFSRDRITVRPGESHAEATFSSSNSGRLLITANSEGLESGQALVLIRPKAASFLSSILSLFETVAHAQSDTELVISSRNLSAVANNKHRAVFQISGGTRATPNPTVRINTNLTEGSIFYGDTKVGTSIANIELIDGVSREIAIVSAKEGKVKISATVIRSTTSAAFQKGPTAHAEIDFTPPLPAQILFDSDPHTIDSHACTVPLSVRLADEGGFPVEPDKERRIYFKSAVESDSNSFSFEPSSVLLAPGQRFAQVMFHLKALPLGNEIKLLATSDHDLRAGPKSIIIKSSIEKVLVTGPQEVDRGGREAEFIVHLVDKNGKHLTADWNRKIDLSIVGGGLAKTEVVIPQGAQQAVVKYSPPDTIGRYTLTAGSSGLQESTYTIRVVNPSYWVVLLAVFGGIVGGIARLLHKNCEFEGLVPRWTGDCLTFGLVRPIVGSLLGGLFFYWALKLGFAQAFGSPRLPAGFDLGTNTAIVFFSGLGGFAGTLVLDRLVGWFLPEGKKERIPSTAATQVPH